MAQSAYGAVLEGEAPIAVDVLLGRFILDGSLRLHLGQSGYEPFQRTPTKRGVWEISAKGLEAGAPYDPFPPPTASSAVATHTSKKGQIDFIFMTRPGIGANLEEMVDNVDALSDNIMNKIPEGRQWLAAIATGTALTAAGYAIFNYLKHIDFTIPHIAIGFVFSCLTAAYAWEHHFQRDAEKFHEAAQGIRNHQNYMWGIEAARYLERNTSALFSPNASLPAISPQAHSPS